MISDWNSYYTPADVAQRMVQSIPLRIPKRAIDICAGEFNLLNAAKVKWPEVAILGVDIENPLSDISGTFIQSEGREYALNYLAKNAPLFDIVLANPPFGKNRILSKFEESSNAIDSNLFDGMQYAKRIEVSMLVANAVLVRPGGYLSAILPATFLQGDAYKLMRQWLYANFTEVNLEALPSKAFDNKEIKTIMLTIKRRPQKFLRLLNSKNSVNSKSKNKDDLYSSLRRGNVSTHHFKEYEKTSVLHSTDIKGVFTSEKDSSHRFLVTSDLPDITASKNDILVVRIGRKAGKASIYTEDKSIHVSDCVFIIKPLRATRDSLIEMVLSGNLSLKLKELKKGLVQDYITTNDIRAAISSL